MRKLIVYVLLLLVSSMVYSQTATAHVLITDDTKTKGAILHIIPDDDPIAGETATLYFDVQQDVLQPGSSVVLAIQNTAGDKTTVPTEIEGALITASYVFPAQGVYRLVFEVRSGSTSHIFTQSQRVSRGITTSALDAPTHEWAKLLLIASGVGLLVLAIVANNRRKSIAAQSVL